MAEPSDFIQDFGPLGLVFLVSDEPGFVQLLELIQALRRIRLAELSLLNLLGSASASFLFLFLPVFPVVGWWRR
jgi:hypothetical protein